ncbi:uncharacterized protein LOC120076262 [Benincasa hispida]|uniref:uncharacterized protein LOC120076262 n=1 Tax=Benincasa hispida TaxID=102211 RepID=UPI001901CC8E|nr:uncharacterized protein LOC120076262 [Benincasa hispida]
MDVKHKEMQFLGTFEVFKETYKVINKNKKIFALAALCFIHPLNIFLSSLMGTLNEILRNLHDYGNTSHLFSHNMSPFWPYDVLYITFIFGNSIISTAGVSHTVAALYTNQEPSINDTMNVVAKVWKRVLVTFICVLLVFLVYHIIAGFALYLIVLPLGKLDETTSGVAFVFYFVGWLYLVVVFQLAGVVSVLEESYGFKALAKSRLLLKDKMASGTVIVLAIYFGFGVFLWLKALVRKMLFTSSSIFMWMHVLGSWSLLLLILVFLLSWLVLETMFYFVCKSYHLESIDMPAISDQDQAPLRSSEC